MIVLLDAQQLDLLTQLIQLDTVGGHEDRTATFLDDYLTQHHIRHQLLAVEPGRHNVVAEIGPTEGPVFALEGHQDVVALGDQNKWHHDPLGAEIIDQRMYGRGTSDMKAGLTAEILTMITLANDPDFHGRVRLLATVGEESSSTNHMQGAQYFAQHGYVDDVTALVTAEPSSVPVDWLKQTPPANPLRFSEEQIQALLPQNHAAEQFVLNFAHKGSLTYAVQAKGKAAHSSTPELGLNAIDALMTYYQQQTAYFQTLTAANPVLGRTIPVVTKFTGGQQLNSVPSQAELFMKVRTVPEVPNEDILAHLNDLIQAQNALGGCQLTLNLLGDKLPVASDPNDKLIQILREVGEHHLQQHLPIGGSAAGTDASELIRANPQMAVTVFGPGNMTAHQIDEYVELPIYEQFIAIFEETIRRYFK
ncbi:succinyl-diaminopimelate desuccinylase [Secundilactobacillus similis DSM 23365 = JCM 2765]|uniref:Succinyl-diaminopimelate desuccinylase n=1 Tax=Secundilactobacillus similis DSM 23365 = JCM 2765 TaxID=1423804 RepID=A0A0R2FAA7_9LACO|nr:succinyl-diaminopimelate desuccinylase [Secundilactobacillus similis DSM 23365 = JCM 2765]